MNQRRSVACRCSSRLISGSHLSQTLPERGYTVLGCTRPLHRDVLKIGGGSRAIRYSALTAFINNSLLSIYCMPGTMLGSGHTAMEKDKNLRVLVKGEVGKQENYATRK